MISKKTRKLYFERLDLGEYNSANIKKLQKKYLRKCDVDGIYGKNTDILLRNLYRTKVYSPHFDLTEFKCECGGKYCTGYPKLLNIQMLITLEALRNKIDSPLTITSGIRCKKYNSSCKGSSPTSEHMFGGAVDVCCTKTKTLKQRKDLMQWLSNQRGHRYTYCNGWEMGTKCGSHAFSAPYMGTSIHFDVKRGYKASKADRQKALEKFLNNNKKKKIGHLTKSGMHQSNFTYSTDKTNSRHWTYVMRAEDKAKREKIAKAMETAIAKKKYIGYSNGSKQYDLFDFLDKKGFDFKNLKSKHYANCSVLASICARVAGLKTPRNSSSYTIYQTWKDKGFEVIKYKKGMKLLRGDVLTATKPAHHTAIYLGLK